jgi:hypothetical protein
VYLRTLRERKELFYLYYRKILGCPGRESIITLLLFATRPPLHLAKLLFMHTTVILLNHAAQSIGNHYEYAIDWIVPQIINWQPIEYVRTSYPVYIKTISTCNVAIRWTATTTLSWASGVVVGVRSWRPCCRKRFLWRPSFWPWVTDAWAQGGRQEDSSHAASLAGPPPCLASARTQLHSCPLLRIYTWP